MKFRAQHAETNPRKWRWVEARDMRHAAAIEGARHGLGERTVYVAEPGGPNHSNGSPMIVHGFKLDVCPRELESAPEVAPR